MGAAAIPMIANCIIAGNGGDGIEMWAARRAGSSPTTTRRSCTARSSATAATGSTAASPSSSIRLSARTESSPAAAQIVADAATVNYCDVEGGHPGTGNIDADPIFVVPGYWADSDDPNSRAAAGDTKAVWVGGDYHLKAGSPCIDAGDPTLPHSIQVGNVRYRRRVSSHGRRPRHRLRRIRHTAAVVTQARYTVACRCLHKARSQPLGISWVAASRPEALGMVVL